MLLVILPLSSIYIRQIYFNYYLNFMEILFYPRGSFQLSVISYQLSVISYQLSVISYQLSVISYQLSVISYQLSVPHRLKNCYIIIVTKPINGESGKNMPI
ncbi:hypothetical protein [Okeania sp. KiyG1]|uniref:hypothetical protein n=1 Tax=Okeania sp. KiyG1 TaxID=2720165 RepID=UPI001922C485|nr:hypothetical protein [Okeania sp. KiyG1]